jgi:hypothetical protein
MSSQAKPYSDADLHDMDTLLEYLQWIPYGTSAFSIVPINLEIILKYLMIYHNECFP